MWGLELKIPKRKLFPYFSLLAVLLSNPNGPDVVSAHSEHLGPAQWQSVFPKENSIERIEFICFAASFASMSYHSMQFVFVLSLSAGRLILALCVTMLSDFITGRWFQILQHFDGIFVQEERRKTSFSQSHRRVLTSNKVRRWHRGVCWPYKSDAIAIRFGCNKSISCYNLFVARVEVLHTNDFVTHAS